MPAREYYLPQRRLVSQDDAAIIERARVPRSRFINTWTLKTAFDAGYLIPIVVDEILPGDHMVYNVTAYVRMATALFPIFDNQRIDTFFFFTPNRLVWANWARFMGEQSSPSESIALTVPQVRTAAGGPPVGSIYDYMGLPTFGQIDAGQTYTVNALPFRMYNLIYNQWFRDQNIIQSLTVPTGDSEDAPTTYVLQRRAKAHDYFTSALPWPQKFTAPTVPLAGLAPVTGLGVISRNDLGNGPFNVFETPAVAQTYQQGKQLWDATAGNQVIAKMVGAVDGTLSIYADLSQATGVAINTFRQAFLIQQLLERDARGGTRYVELIRSHFGVTNPDFRLQRPEYIGGGQTQLQITPIAQTAPTTGVPLGALGGVGTAAGQHKASYAATEHGFIIGLINIRTELSYQQGLHRMYTRSTRYDYYWPSLAMLGEQAIIRGEIYKRAHADDQVIFGYQERWHEYRTRYSQVTGIMRSTATGTLDAWHLAQRFTADPLLNQAFIEDTPPMSRVLAAGAQANGQQYMADLMIHRIATRPVPTFGTPATLGRF